MNTKPEVLSFYECCKINFVTAYLMNNLNFNLSKFNTLSSFHFASFPTFLSNQKETKTSLRERFEGGFKGANVFGPGFLRTRCP